MQLQEMYLDANCGEPFQQTRSRPRFLPEAPNATMILSAELSMTSRVRRTS